MTEKQRQNKEDKIVKFLSERLCINLNCIERESTVSQGTLRKVVDKVPGRSLTIDSITNLIPVLKNYGYKD